jgi:hypothetical protein
MRAILQCAVATGRQSLKQRVIAKHPHSLDAFSISTTGSSRPADVGCSFWQYRDFSVSSVVQQGRDVAQDAGADRSPVAEREEDLESGIDFMQDYEFEGSSESQSIQGADPGEDDGMVVSPSKPSQTVCLLRASTAPHLPYCKSYCLLCISPEKQLSTSSL